MMSKYIQIVKDFITLFNTRNHAEIDNFLTQFVSDEVLAETFHTASGTWIIVKDKFHLKEMIEYNFSSENDLMMITETLSESENKVFWAGTLEGSKWNTPGGINIQEEFEIKAVWIFEFDNNKIIYLKYFLDTFEIMKLSGRAILDEGNKQKIQNYVELLLNTGMISKEIVKVS